MKVTAWSFGNGLYRASLLLGSHFNSKATPTINTDYMPLVIISFGARLSLPLPFHSTPFHSSSQSLALDHSLTHSLHASTHARTHRLTHKHTDTPHTPPYHRYYTYYAAITTTCTTIYYTRLNKRFYVY